MKAVSGKESHLLNRFEELFGSVSVMQKYYRETYQAYRNTRAGSGERQSLSPDNADCDVEIVHVSYTDDTHTYIGVDLRATVNVADGYFVLEAEALPENGQETDAGRLLTGIKGITLKEITCNFMGSQAEVSLKIPAGWFNRGVEPDVRIHALVYRITGKVLIYEAYLNVAGYGVDYTGSFVIKHPVRTHKDLSNKDINISYISEGKFNDSLRDYFYFRNQVADGCLRIPSEGEIKVQGVNLQSIKNVSLRAFTEKKTGFYHQNPSAKLLDSKTISWKLPDSFGHPYSELLDGWYCYVGYDLEIVAEASGMKYTFVITNRQEAQQSLNKFMIDRINIYRDCFHPNTRIQMADGTQKNAEDIKAGDLLAVPCGECRVKEMQKTSMRSAMVYIKGDNSQKTCVSINHPFETDRGLVCARYLQEGMYVHGMQGNVKIVESCISPETEVTLCAITLEGGGRLYADGFVAGDSMAEFTAAELANNLRYCVPEKWRADYDAWMEREA